MALLTEEKDFYYYCKVSLFHCLKATLIKNNNYLKNASVVNRKFDLLKNKPYLQFKELSYKNIRM